LTFFPRNLARKYKTGILEFWDFIDAYADFSTDEGLVTNVIKLFSPSTLNTKKVSKGYQILVMVAWFILLLGLINVSRKGQDGQKTNEGSSKVTNENGKAKMC
jgi:hypothetical protein